MWSDRDTELDCLGYSSYVTVLADVCIHKDLAPLTLGIFGSWGSGKTSLMRMLKVRLDQSSTEATGEVQAGLKVKTIWFNAWRYEGREEAQSALIHAILTRLSEDKTLLDDAREVFHRLKEGASVLKLAKFITKTAVTMTPDIGGLLECFQEQSQKIAETMEQFEKDFEELLKKMRVSRIIVFIDDLDRCSSGKVIETFETIKLFLNTPACTFVIGADAEKIEQDVGEIYHVTEKQRQKDYLEKIVQIPFTIPEQNLRDIACYVGMLIIGQHLEETGWTALIQDRSKFFTKDSKVEQAFLDWPNQNQVHFQTNIVAISDELKAVLPHVEIIGKGLRGNPRQIKRFLNILALRRRLATANNLGVSPDLLIKTTILEYVWPDFFTALGEMADPVTGHSALLDEMLKAYEDEKGQPSESQMVMGFLAVPGLTEFLATVPKLTGDVDLTPYLFLAQTSLTQAGSHGLVPIDEHAKELARAMENADPIRAKAAAMRAAAEDPTTAASIVRILLNDLPVAKEPVIRTQILLGLRTICSNHNNQSTAVIRALSTFETAGNDAVAIAADAFLSSAEQTGNVIPEELRNRFIKSSKLAEALAPHKKRGTKRI